MGPFFNLNYSLNFKYKMYLMLEQGYPKVNRGVLPFCYGVEGAN